MSLEEIKQKLYQKEADTNLAKHDSSEYDAKAAFENASKKNEFSKSEDLWEEKKKGLGQEEKKAFRYGAFALGGIILIVLLIIGFLKYKQYSFQEEKVVVSISGLEEADSGKTLTYEISYKNENWVSLKNAILKINYPEGFKPEDNPGFESDSLTSGFYKIGDIKRGGGGKFSFKGKMYSPKGSLAYLKANLAYSPSSVSTEFVSESQIGIKVLSSPIVFEVLAPLYISNGDEVNYAISYKNIGSEDFINVRIKADFPEGFTFSRSEPSPSEGENIWYIGHLSAGQEGKVKISGKLEGSKGDIKNIVVYIGEAIEGKFFAHNEEKAETKIESSPLFIRQTVNGKTNLNVSAGDYLQFEIYFKNEGDIGLKDAIITEKIDSKVIDYTQLNTSGGSFDENNKIITWKPSSLPSLKLINPGQEGLIRFSAKVKNVIPVEGVNDKNFVVSTVAKIDSPDVPTPIAGNKIIAGNKVDMKLNSKLVLDVKGYYNDSSIENSGPVPPKVNEETTYTIHWIVRNVSNDISDVRLESSLPSWASMTGKINPEDAKINYDERANTIVWEIGNMKAGEGISGNPKEVSFQVKIKPSSNQIGRKIEILNKSKISAKDLFTGESLSAEVENKTTDLTEDKKLGGEGKVAE